MASISCLSGLGRSRCWVSHHKPSLGHNVVRKWSTSNQLKMLLHSQECFLGRRCPFQEYCYRLLMGVPSKRSAVASQIFLQQHRCMVIVTQHKVGGNVGDELSVPAPPSSNESASSKPTPSLPINNDKFPLKDDKNETNLLTDNFLVITESCWKHVERLAAKKGYDMDKVYLRVFVDAGGCSGFTYQFEFHSVDDSEDTIDDEKEDLVWVGPQGCRVVVDVGSMGLLRGATLDYVVEMIKSTFEIRDNPQSESACGCGSSFALKNFSANPAVD